MLNELKELPARLRMYDSYEYVRKLLQSYTKVCVLYQHHSRKTNTNTILGIAIGYCWYSFL